MLRPTANLRFVLEVDRPEQWSHHATVSDTKISFIAL
jgi:hypothetical protein